jgi:Type II secretion system (T2SS), protein F
MSSSLALSLLAAAVLLWSKPGLSKARLSIIRGHSTGSRPWTRWAESRLALPIALAASIGGLVTVLCGWPSGLPAGGVAAGVAWVAARRLLGRRPRTDTADDQLGLAAGWDLLAACLRSGMPVPTAALAVADQLPPDAATALRTTADLLALGADPVSAWAPALANPATAELARGARRTARSGTALAGVAAGLAAAIRQTAGDVAEARAQRAGVLITGPLGLCFLPAFICLGIVPVVAGLTAQLSIHT